MTYTIDL